MEDFLFHVLYILQAHFHQFTTSGNDIRTPCHYGDKHNLHKLVQYFILFFKIFKRKCKIYVLVFSALILKTNLVFDNTCIRLLSTNSTLLPKGHVVLIIYNNDSIGTVVTKTVKTNEVCLTDRGVRSKRI